MPRQPRLLLPNSYYHIMTRGNNHKVVFKKPKDYQYYLDLINRFKNELPFELYHFCLMPNHVHLLVQTKNAGSFSVFMKKINLAYFHYYKRKYNWIGHFWQDRFKSQTIGKDSYFIQCGKYIELNPVRAGLVKKPEEYLFSSYRYYSQGLKSHLITEDIFYQELGINQKEKQKNYTKMTINELINQSYCKKVWGSPKQCYNESRKTKYNMS